MMKITIEQAYEIWNDRSNGADEGRSDSKGGRAWICGEFQLCELEALCMILRHEAGHRAEGLPELLSNMRPVPELKSLSINQQLIVNALSDLDSEGVVNFRWIAAASTIGNVDTTRRVTRALARMGIAEHVKGLMTEQGEVCGSGYRLTSMGRQMLTWAKEDAS